MGNNNISYLPHDQCCGCRVCGDICPKKCISFSEDTEGFFYPKVDNDICVSCGKCLKVCPEINPTYHEQSNTALAAYAKDLDERNLGSSGGVFGLIAKEVIENGGKVWGAAFNQDLKLLHVCARDKSELTTLMKSKYIQSNPEGVYRQIKSDLHSGLITLFSGTPCQCNALRNAVGDNPKLITIDFICHGVPSQSLFDKSIACVESKKNLKIEKFCFRSKYKNAPTPRVFSYRYVKNNQEKTENGVYYEYPYLYGFYKYVTLRPSCYKCKWACPTRTSDVTLGDFWGIEKYDSNLNAHNGVSQVIINTPKGQSLIDRLISDNSIVSKPFPIKIAIENNGCLQKPPECPSIRNDFFRCLETKTFDEVIKKFLVPKRKWILDIYFGMPSFCRKLIRKIL